MSISWLEETVLTKPAKEIAKRELDGFVGKGYGIYSGPNVRWAKLRFSAVRARLVSREQWHPLQRSLQENDGSLLLEVPFTDMCELAMDVLRQGQHVEVLEPPELRAAVKAELNQALSQYSSED
jgi:predicted DNA-binding transcriptional regulator YafY